MKPSLLVTVALLTSIGLATPAWAENLAQVKQGTPAMAANPTPEQVLQACVRDQAQTLPSPYTDVPQNHWAYKAVLSMYYCGAYREQIPPEQFQQLPEQRRSSEM